jgi:hypothetical protein
MLMPRLRCSFFVGRGGGAGSGGIETRSYNTIPVNRDVHSSFDFMVRAWRKKMQLKY